MWKHKNRISALLWGGGVKTNLQDEGTLEQKNKDTIIKKGTFQAESTGWHREVMQTMKELLVIWCSVGGRDKEKPREWGQGLDAGRHISLVKGVAGYWCELLIEMTEWENCVCIWPPEGYPAEMSGNNVMIITAFFLICSKHWLCVSPRHFQSTLQFLKEGTIPIPTKSRFPEGSRSNRQKMQGVGLDLESSTY